MSDVQAQGGDIWIEEAEVVVITELYEGLGLQSVVSGGTRHEWRDVGKLAAVEEEAGTLKCD